MMKQFVTAAAALALAVPVMADTFGTGANQFTIDFVTISGATNPSSGYGIVDGDYRISTYEVTNAQWAAFEAEAGQSYTGSYWTGNDLPVTRKNWYAAAQFVNWLNTSNGHQAAYKFSGTQGESDYTFTVWDVTDTGYNASNPYRNSNAFYFLPTEDEWVKAAYWNGTTIQLYATLGDTVPTAGVDSNYGQLASSTGPWAVGNGSEELNGTYDMMGNVYEWIESPYSAGAYSFDSIRVVRGNSYYYGVGYIRSSYRGGLFPHLEYETQGFRVASVPEPASLVLLGLGGLMLRRKP